MTSAALVALAVHLWGLYRDHGPPTPGWFSQADKLEHLVGFGLPCFLVLLAAARALAGVVSDAELNASYITPSVFNAEVHTAVAAAVRRAAGGPAELPSESVDAEAAV